MENLKQIVDNYEMGFITSQEFIAQYIDVLSLLGAEKELVDIVNDINTPLANFLVGIVKGSGNLIGNFNK